MAFRNGNAHGVPGPGIDVVGIKVASQTPRFEADNRIGLGIERFASAKDGKPERIPFQPVGMSGQRLFHQVPEERSPPWARLERRTVQDTLQLRANLGRRRTGRCIPATGGVERWGHRIPPGPQPKGKIAAAQSS